MGKLHKQKKCRRHFFKNKIFEIDWNSSKESDNLFLSVYPYLCFSTLMVLLVKMEKINTTKHFYVTSIQNSKCSHNKNERNFIFNFHRIYLFFVYLESSFIGPEPITGIKKTQNVQL